MLIYNFLANPRPLGNTPRALDDEKMNRGDLLPLEIRLACQRWGVLPSRWCLAVSTARQRMRVYERLSCADDGWPVPRYRLRSEHRISSSRFGLGQLRHSNRTPLGLHCIAEKHGGGYPMGAVFESRRFQGYTWQGLPKGQIVHRIFWLAGLEPGFNRGGEVDTYERFVYIHGFGDALSLGRPASHGCIHLSPDDLIPLFDLLPTGTLVWIGED